MLLIPGWNVYPLEKCVSIGCSPLPFSPPPSSRNHHPEKRDAENKNLFSVHPRHFLLGAERWFKRAGSIRLKYFFGVGKEFCCSRGKKTPKTRLPTGFNFICNVHGNQPHMLGWTQDLDFLAGFFFYEPILAGFQDVQIAHIIFE